MKECLQSARVSILVNGSPTTEFCLEKSLRQGDPLSPFLFIIVAEGLNMLFQRAKSLGLIKRAMIGLTEFNDTHLQLADNTIVFCEADEQDTLNVKRILRENFFDLELTLVKVVLSSLVVYYLSIFKLPGSVAKLLDKIQARFLWGGSNVKKKLHLVKWEEVTDKKSFGGLGIKRL
ncbi:uncharacterized protein LOC114302885 [Camellia sinensis]|uniref:uncharacterized protein LOC114302885 n=1 Tax=Camellia sinensis TaxID=4442 RepID=UPI0010356C17|nr:uncharacterized protein LOC114302885 [Camellia sinensis]